MNNLLNKTPKYQQIIQYIIDKIEKKEFKEGQKLPTEEELCSYFNVSRISVRKAYDELMHQGYIIRKHGKGSYVNTSLMVMQLNSLQGFTEEMRSRGIRVTSKVLKFELVNAEQEVSNKLQIEKNSKVYAIERLRYTDNEPMAIETVFIPYFYCPDLENHNLTNSLYEILQNYYKISPVKASQSIEADLANKREHEILNIKLKAPILKIERISYLNNNTPMEYVTSLYRGDKYKFYVMLNK
ncbi:GntR family transcriptional regulator [Clostridium swellfunianum]|uniref:GntR family transcriptional regulator n=1 Tax=Clostridium swellfunianum TaxID=1367462 RepID=UPI00202E8211|nr:GntR family transcriptional regulator [Clostridium swellfunianum]MCM0646910.1 GntR family transcriptional regulator [Clostridium swellfunianum]